MIFNINETANQGYSPFDVLLDDTVELNEMADNIQKAKGMLSLFDDSGEYDGNDWYNFYLQCDVEGVKELYFEYGIKFDQGGTIELSEEDKQAAFDAVLKFFGGMDGYKQYIKEWS